MMRCLTCGYDLRGLPEPRCPECGRTFDTNDPQTYAVEGPDARELVKFARIAAVFLLVPSALIVTGFLFALAGSFEPFTGLICGIAGLSGVFMLPGLVIGVTVFFRALSASQSATDEDRRSFGYAIILTAGSIGLLIVGVLLLFFWIVPAAFRYGMP